MTLDLKPEIAAALEALASAKGLSVEDKLASQGMIYPLTSLSGVVLGLVRRGGQ